LDSCSLSVFTQLLYDGDEFFSANITNLDKQESCRDVNDNCVSCLGFDNLVIQPNYANLCARVAVTCTVFGGLKLPTDTVHLQPCIQLGTACDYQGCDTCTQNGGCGWCRASNKCFAKGNAGPYCATCNRTDWVSVAGICEQVCAYQSCDTCTRNGCGWCRSTNKCYARVDSGPYDATCDASAWVTGVCDTGALTYNQENKDTVTVVAVVSVSAVCLGLLIFFLWKRHGRKAHSYVRQEPRTDEPTTPEVAYVAQCGASDSLLTPEQQPSSRSSISMVNDSSDGNTTTTTVSGSSAIN